MSPSRGKCRSRELVLLFLVLLDAYYSRAPLRPKSSTRVGALRNPLTESHNVGIARAGAEEGPVPHDGDSCTAIATSFRHLLDIIRLGGTV